MEINKVCIRCGARLDWNWVPESCRSCLDDALGKDWMPTGPFESLGSEIGRLVQEKQAAYGNSFGKSGQVMRLLYPDGIKPEQMDDALAVVRVLDKLFRIATAKDAFGESPWRDIAGYGLLGASRAGKGKP